VTVGDDQLAAYQDIKSPAVGTLDVKIHLNSNIWDTHKGGPNYTADIKEFFYVLKCRFISTFAFILLYPCSNTTSHLISLTPMDKTSLRYTKECILNKASISASARSSVPLLKPSHSHGNWWLWHQIFLQSLCQSFVLCTQKKYSITVDWTGSTYQSLHKLESWQGLCFHFMPEYLPKSLASFNHKPQSVHNMHPISSPVYGEKTQYAVKMTLYYFKNKPPCASKPYKALFSIKYMQLIQPSILHSMKSPINKQPAESTTKACEQFMDNLYIHLLPPFAFTHDMVLSLVSDAGYLVLPNARARCATLNKLSNHPTSNPPIINLMDLLTSSSRNPWRPIFWSRRW